MKVLLVNAASPTYQAYYNKARCTLANGLLYIAATLERAGHEVQIYDGFVDERKPEDFVEWKPALIGFSVIAGPYLEGSILQSKQFKALLPDVKTAWGNLQPTVLPAQCVIEPYVDFVVMGAGEYTMLELVTSLETGAPSLSEIKGLGYKVDGKPVINERRPFIKNLDELPDPAWHLVKMERYSEIGLSTSRGCAYKCAYCYHSAFDRSYASELSAERVVEQLERVQKLYKAKFVRFNEDNFAFNRKRLRQVCKILIERKNKVKWACESRADLSEADIILMKKAGCVAMGLGPETGSQRMLDFIQKGISLEQMEKTFWLLTKHKIRIVIYLIYGFPTETVDDMKSTRAMLDRLDNPAYLLSRFIPIPGSVLYDYCVNNNLIKAPQTLEEWPEFIVSHGHKINLSQVPQEMIDEYVAHFNHTYAEVRFMFTVRHNPGYFLLAFTNPAKLCREMKELLKYHLHMNKLQTIRKEQYASVFNAKPVPVEASLKPRCSS
jgi:anaerobic magnesium-protoporphyrin IX monomethyl ester cyclase